MNYQEMSSQAKNEVVLIAAVASNGVIGRNGTLPWHFQEDLQHFKELTMGHPVIMGRRTYQSIIERLRKPLSGRANIVLSKRDDFTPTNVEVAGSLEEAISAAKDCKDYDTNLIYVIGGASLYAEAMPFASRLEITKIHQSYEGDVYFPTIDTSVWKESVRVDRPEYSFVTYVRREG